MCAALLYKVLSNLLLLLPSDLQGFEQKEIHSPPTHGHAQATQFAQLPKKAKTFYSKTVIFTLGLPCWKCLLKSQNNNNVVRTKLLKLWKALWKQKPYGYGVEGEMKCTLYIVLPLIHFELGYFTEVDLFRTQPKCFLSSCFMYAEIHFFTTCFDVITNTVVLQLCQCWLNFLASTLLHNHSGQWSLAKKPGNRHPRASARTPNGRGGARGS